MLMNAIHSKNKHLIAKQKLIILLRGHIRQSFSNDLLYEFTKRMKEIYDIRIYIHTWDIQQSNISWKPMEVIDTKITPKLIREYFRDCPIHSIQIDNDRSIQLIGNLEGTLTKYSPMPIVGWKNMWYGMYTNISKIKKEINNTTIPIVNLRFDLFEIFRERLNYISVDRAVQFVEDEYRSTYVKNKFTYDDLVCGIDNIFIGNVTTIYKLISHFHKNLDEIMINYPKIKSQEYIVFLENNKIDDK